MTKSRWGVVAACLALLATPALAQKYPDRPIKLIVPISVGSITDVASRLMAQELQEQLGQPVVVVNRPGAAMVLGGTDCAKSPPDGYTLCLVSPDTMAFNPLTIPNLSYNPDKDFTPVIDMYNVIEGLIVPGASDIGTIEQLRAKAAAEPGKLNYGTLGERTTTDAFRQWLGEHWNTKFTAIPYKGGSEITAALLGNDIDIAKIGIGNMVSQIKAGKVKVLALTGVASLAANARHPDLCRSRLRRLSGRPDLLGRRGADRHAGADRGAPARRIADDPEQHEIHRFRQSEFSRAESRLDRRFCHVLETRPPERRGAGE